MWSTSSSNIWNVAAILFNGSATAATATTLSGPTSGTVGVASTNFTAGANGSITGTVVVTPSDGGAGGTFTPTSVSISSGTPTGTFTYTAASTSPATIGIGDNGGLTDATSITFTAASSVLPVAFAGTVPGQSATVGAAFSLNLASYYSGTQTPFTYTVQSGALPAGLTLSGSTISGTPTTAGTISGIVIRATDASSNTANSNSFSITVAAATLYGLDFDDPALDLEFGNVAGTLTGIGLQTGVAVTVDIYSPTSMGTRVHAASATTHATTATIPRIENASLSGQAYVAVIQTTEADPMDRLVASVILEAAL